MKKMKLKISKGSVLVFSLIVLAMILVMALGISAVTITERKTASGTGKSIKAFENAESGVEEVIQKAKGVSASTTLSSVFTDSCSCASGIVTCDSSKYKITLYKTGETENQVMACTDTISQIVAIKSVGTYSDTVRAVETAWAQTVTAGITGGCIVNGSTDAIMSGHNWGEGCKAEGATSIPECSDAAISSDYECGTSSYDTYRACICIKVL